MKTLFITDCFHCGAMVLLIPVCASHVSADVQVTEVAIIISLTFSTSRHHPIPSSVLFVFKPVCAILSGRLVLLT